MAKEAPKLVLDYEQILETHRNLEDGDIEVILEINYKGEIGTQKISGEAIHRTLFALSEYPKDGDQLEISIKEIKAIKQ